MKRIGILVVAAMLLMTALPVSSQQIEDSSVFEQTLYRMLQQEGWSAEDLQKLFKEEVDWKEARFQDAEMIATCLAYAKEMEGKIGPEVEAQLVLSIMTMAQEMRALGFGEPQIIRAALNGTREAVGELAQLRETERLRTGEDAGVGEVIRHRFEQQLQTAMQLEARLMVQSRVREEQNSRPGDLLVPPGPQGPGGPTH
jgi:hypothetical protein